MKKWEYLREKKTIIQVIGYLNSKTRNLKQYHKLSEIEIMLQETFQILKQVKKKTSKRKLKH